MSDSDHVLQFADLIYSTREYGLLSTLVSVNFAFLATIVSLSRSRYLVFAHGNQFRGNEVLP